MLADYRNTLLPAFDVPVDWSGSVGGCRAGDTSAGSKNAVLQTLNYYRRLAGLPGVTLDAGYSAAAQEVALLMSAQHALSHQPTSDWKCYTAVAAAGASRSNLALGYAGPVAVQAYMQDLNKPEVGHRRWLLYPLLQRIGTGDTHDTNALWVLGEFASAQPAGVNALGVAWPPRGFVPWSDKVAAPGDVWSFSLPGADFSAAVLTMKDDRGQAIALSPPAWQNSGPGDPVALWTIAAPASLWSRAPADTRLSVSLRNVRVGAEIRDFDYDVVFVVP